jgi:hypothetical protein
VRRAAHCAADDGGRHEVPFGVVRREHLLGRLGRTAATQAFEDLEDWPAEPTDTGRCSGAPGSCEPPFRGWDAIYVALAEALEATLVTADARLAAAPGPTCRIEVLG